MQQLLEKNQIDDINLNNNSRLTREIERTFRRYITEMCFRKGFENINGQFGAFGGKILARTNSTQDVFIR